MRFPKLVIEEATNLREFATERERANLEFTELRPNQKSDCVYGLMTGHCDSPRAQELIKKCCRRVYKALDGIYSKDEGKLNPLNGSPVEKDRDTYWSPIEVFIVRDMRENDSKNNRKLLSFIKGEIDNL